MSITFGEKAVLEKTVLYTVVFGGGTLILFAMARAATSDKAAEEIQASIGMGNLFLVALVWVVMIFMLIVGEEDRR